MKKAKLFLICPDCNIEPALRNEFGQESYFLTALGSVFVFSDFDFTMTLDRFINQEVISEIIVVNDPHCTFIENTIGKRNNYYTKAEQELTKLQQNNSKKFAFLNTNKQQELLAKLNIYRQAYELLDAAFIGSKISDGLISISGLIYHRDGSRFERVILAL